MFNLFRKSRLLSLLAFSSLITMSSSLMAWDYCEPCEQYECNRFYIGAYGGGIFSDSTHVSQLGTAFFPQIDLGGGPLAVNARGHAKSTSAGFGGAQIGYEWLGNSYNFGCSDWSIAPAAEIEAFFYSHKKKGHLINDTTRLEEHDFLDSFKLNTSVCLVNVVFSLKNSSLCGFTPYVGAGIGATHISLKNAKSEQIAPLEPEVNHFSRRNDSSWAFAAQVKAGVRYKIWDSFHVFAEYRYLFVDSSDYVLGSTVAPNHVATSPWNVKVGNLNYNAFAIGFQYDL